MSQDQNGSSARSDQGESQEDYYFDSNGLRVFTRAYHLKRGYCCGSGCRHCPWRGTPEYRGPAQEKRGKA